jgi:hypothetical protein
MFGHGIWRPAAVAVVMSTAAFLPQGVAVAATPDTIGTVSCSELSVQIRNGSLSCRPLQHDGVDGVFIGLVPPSSPPVGRRRQRPPSDRPRQIHRPHHHRQHADHRGLAVHRGLVGQQLRRRFHQQFGVQQFGVQQFGVQQFGIRQLGVQLGRLDRQLVEQQLLR